MKKVFEYISNLWHGRDNKPSLPKVLAIVLTVHFMVAFQAATDAKLIVSAGLIASLLGIRAYTAAQDTREKQTTLRTRVKTESTKPLDEDERPDIEPGPQE